MTFHEGDVVSVSQVYRIAILVNYCSEVQIGVVKHFEDIVCCARNFAHLCQNIFLGCSKHMLLLSEGIFKNKLVLLKFRAFFNK